MEKAARIMMAKATRILAAFYKACMVIIPLHSSLFVLH